MTNREVFLNQIHEMNSKKLAQFIESASNRCSKCSNCYWDGSQQKCHMNINKSTCLKGIKEWVESNSDENLQNKYSKKYYTFTDFTIANTWYKILETLYEEGLIQKLNPRCGTCSECEGASCPDCWYNATLMAEQYIEEQNNILGNPNKVTDIEKRYANVKNYIADILVPQIQDQPKRQYIICTIKSLLNS